MSDSVIYSTPKTAIVLAAGLGTRMRPLTLKIPKSLVKINGYTLLDRALDQLVKAGVERVVVNVHHLADQIEEHLKSRSNPEIIISDEREKLLDSAGAIVKALPFLGKKPFFILNADTFWHDAGYPILLNLARQFFPATMDMLLMTIGRHQIVSPEKGDFLYNERGQLQRAPANHPHAVLYGGVIITIPAFFKHAILKPDSLNRYFNLSISKGRLYGLALEGSWYTVGTVDMIEKVSQLLTQRGE